MDEQRIGKWVRRVAAAVAILAVLGLAVAVWVASSALEGDWLVPTAVEPELDLEIATVGSGRVVLTRTPLTEREGVWGLAGTAAYGQVSTVTEVREEVVERSFRALEGSFGPGDRARFDEYVYLGTPLSAHGIGFEDVRVAGELGVLPAWRIEGERATWVVAVHSRSADRSQALRVLPALRDAGFPVLVVSYRNDPGTPPSPDGRYAWGGREWRDLEAAIRFALLQGAEEIVLLGYGMGGAIVSVFLHESEHVSAVAGVVLDSPMLDLGAAVDTAASDAGVPGLLTGGAKLLATLRFGVDWGELDQVERAAEFDVPVLLMQGDADAVVPVETGDAFAAARPDLVTYERFARAEHLQLWNADPVRYETALVAFLNGVSAPAG